MNGLRNLGLAFAWCYTSILKGSSVHLEPHPSSFLNLDDIEQDAVKTPFLFEAHELTLTCYELRHRCIHEAKGLMILQNECYTPADSDDGNRDIQTELFKHSKASDFPLHGFHLCRYYTCRTFAEHCIANANGRYITTLTCEHHYDHERELRYFMDMRCDYNDTCSHRRQHCEHHKSGWDIARNECIEIHQKHTVFNSSYVEYDHTCEYREPQEWEFNDELLEFWQNFDVFEYDEYAVL